MYVLGTYTIIPSSEEMFAAMIDGVKSQGEGRSKFLIEMDSQEAECQIAEGEDKLFLDRYRKRDDAMPLGIGVGIAIEVIGLATCSIAKLVNRAFPFWKGAAITTGSAVLGGSFTTLAYHKVKTCQEKGSDLGADRRERLRIKVSAIAEQLKSLESQPENDDSKQLKAALKGFTKISTHYEKACKGASDKIDWNLYKRENDGIYYHNRVLIRFDKDGIVENQSQFYDARGNYIYETKEHYKREDQ